MEQQQIAERIKEQFPDMVEEIGEFRGDVTVVLKPEAVADVVAFLKQDEDIEMNMFSDLAGADYYPASPRFGVQYILRSVSYAHGIRLKTYVTEEEAVIPTITHIYPGAGFPEREVYDMFGVEFEGNKDMRRILMPHDWTGHPLRKDYPIGYEEVQFSFNYERVQNKKPHPQE